MKYILSMLAITALAFSVTSEISGRSPVEPGTQLEINNVNGDITISHIDGNDIVIDIVKRSKKDQTELDKVKVDILPGETFLIATKYLEDNADVAVDISLGVPDHITKVSIGNVNGKITVEGLTADLEVEHANGDVTITEIRGSVEVALANGDVRIEGAVVINGIALANGSIIAEVHELPEDGIQFELANGTIKVYIVENINADIEANIVMGNVTVHDLQIESSRTTKNSIEGTLNAGGPLIELSAATGNIHLYQLKD